MNVEKQDSSTPLHLAETLSRASIAAREEMNKRVCSLEGLFSVCTRAIEILGRRSDGLDSAGMLFHWEQKRRREESIATLKKLTFHVSMAATEADSEEKRLDQLLQFVRQAGAYIRRADDAAAAPLWKRLWLELVR